MVSLELQWTHAGESCHNFNVAVLETNEPFLLVHVSRRYRWQSLITGGIFMQHPKQHQDRRRLLHLPTH